MLDSDNCRPNMTNRRTRRQDSRGTNVARILTAAETLCAIYGSGKTNVRDIASYLKMSPANVYRFFPSKLAWRDAGSNAAEFVFRALEIEPEEARQRRYFGVLAAAPCDPARIL
jgi:AcrR family transcriptional regulator